ncbi:MAG: hypothetical protein BWY44_00385 [Candidatus Omnitrophica bacterium ADurb.Bin292]|nr:MAG: hypothetical protein BWY44_00385 [Candidatus Omnitrophica bacterium ADurb.Bin292]
MKKISRKKKTKSLKSVPLEKKDRFSDLLALMTQLGARFESLEKKVEMVLSKGQVFLSRGVVAPENHHPVSSGVRPDKPSDEPPSVGGPVPVKQANASGRRKNLFQAVCADCRKTCEVPFKPTGERPVYCNECFRARKSFGRSDKSTARNGAPANCPQEVQRRVTVIKKGAGKLTISDIVPVQDKAQKSVARHRRPAKTHTKTRGKNV